MTDVSKMQKHVLDIITFIFLNYFDCKLRHLQKSATPPKPISEKFHPLIFAQLHFFQNYLIHFCNLSKNFKPSPHRKKRSPPYVRLVLQQIFTWEKKDGSSFCFYAKHYFTNLCLSLSVIYDTFKF